MRKQKDRIAELFGNIGRAGQKTKEQTDKQSNRVYWQTLLFAA
ncbi:MAG: hypothetical protein V8Q17_06715 [Acutalibacteraceae bacterium]